MTQLTPVGITGLNLEDSDHLAVVLVHLSQALLDLLHNGGKRHDYYDEVFWSTFKQKLTNDLIVDQVPPEFIAHATSTNSHINWATLL